MLRWLRWFWYYLKTMCSLAKHQWSNCMEWDDSYLLSLIQWKMKRMRKYHVRQNYIIKDGPKVVAELDEAIDLIQKIMDDDFGNREYEELNAYTGGYESLKPKPSDDRIAIPMNELYRYVNQEARDNPDKVKKLQERWRIMYELEYIGAWHKLGKIIETNLPGWWD
jgi:hypothetical protein